MKFFSRILMFLAGVLLLGGCSTTKRIPEGELLYTGIKKVEITGPEGEKVPEAVSSKINTAVAFKPNNSLFGSSSIRYPFPLGLWAYNHWPNPEKGLRHWLYEKFAREPVLISDVRPNQRVRSVDQLLDDNGFFSGKATYELVPQKNKKKAKIIYKVATGPAYMVDTVEMMPDTCYLFHAIDSLARLDPYLCSNSRYSADSLSVARTRITNALRNDGFYYFRPEYIEYLADSLQTPKKIALRMMLASNIPPMMLRRYKTGDVKVFLFRNRGGGTPDTIPLPKATLIQMKPSRFRQGLIPECVTFRKGQYFAVQRMNSTQTRFARLGIFNNIDINVFPDTVAKEPTLDVEVACTFDVPLEMTVELNASSKSNSYLGPGALIGVTNHNIFGGGEQLSFSATGSYEWQTGKNASSIFNSYEVGLSASLAFPRMIAPRFIKRRNQNLNWTRITLNGDLLNRPHYFKMGQFNFSYNYDWQSSRHSSHTFTPFKLTYTKLMKTTHDFDSITSANPAVALSFRSQYIPQLAYTYTYDTNIGYDNTINWTFTVQEAGNLFWSIYQLAGKKGEKKLFGTPFSQFIKGMTQIVYGRRLTGSHWLVMRGLVGAAHAYGNSTEVPYSEQFYAGGANSIRAFTVRSIGPGSYRAPASIRDGYFDQTGTFKFEFNVEYRFPILGPLAGALFIDTGNVWLLKKDPLRPGGELRAKTFLKDLALGTGVGLRFDISMLVVRGDLGIGIHAPYDTGKRGYYNMESFWKSLAFHLAIGYPF